jgi:hypothetical protein
MAGRTSKKQVILECREQHHMEEAREAELRLIQKEIGARLGGSSQTSLSYIAEVLRQAGTRVDYEDPYTPAALPEPYASRLEGALQFHNLASAEAALRTLDAAYRDYQAASDPAGAQCARTLILRGKQRAERLAASPRVSPAKRQEKREIAGWFRVWLENPDLFFDWLSLRKQTEEFRQLFPEAVAKSGQLSAVSYQQERS